MSMQRHADTLRFIAERLGLAGLRHVVRQPGVNEAYRISIHYYDGRHPDQVATLVVGAHRTVTLSVAYRRMHNHPAFEYSIDPDRFRMFDQTMRRLGFDHTDDQDDMPYLGADLWLLERSSGTFFHDLVLAPATAEGVHRDLMQAVTAHLKEAVRAIQPD